ncbi:MAG: outer membrane beta-barrel protein [Bacteroidia bacterium]|nr:outer membrane beta-barrel protein [Bacteroidia bacterium]
MLLLKKYLPLIFILICFTGIAQVNVTGTVVDETGQGLPGATVKAINKDSAFVTGSVTDVNGSFTLTLANNNNFLLLVSSPVYFGRGLRLSVQTKTENIELGKIKLKEDRQNLKEVVVSVTQVRGEQKGDTTSFNADAFKVNKDATAEDLVKKMPGVTSDNNGVKVNGETVQKVLVDGKPFFGDDPNATLKNLPADLIDKVQVFDKMSDQSAFTGFTDGDQQKTINLITKKEKNNGTFGRVYAGIGADEDETIRYQSGASINNFKDKRRVSLLLLSNNINQQNFSSADITGAMGSPGGGGGRQGGSGNFGGGGGNFGGGSSLMTSPQSGNNITQSAGLNYSDAWGKKVLFSGSYFYNYTDNKNSSNSTRNYFTGLQNVYKQITSSSTINQNHRLNFRLEYTIDSANKLFITPSLSYQNNAGKSLLDGKNSLADLVFLSEILTNSKNNNLGFDFSNNILFQHKFKKQGRTFSINLNTSQNERNANGSYNSYNIYTDTTISGLNQNSNTYSYTKRIATNISYSEPINKNAQLQINYNPSYSINKSDKSTKDFNWVNDSYDLYNSNLSNKYDNIYQTQRAGISYRYNKNKLNLSVGLDGQQATLDGKQDFPSKVVINQSFNNLLPNAMLNYKFSRSKNLRVYYRSSTHLPSTTQLQNVIDISNPLQIKSGNSDLKQSFENYLNIRYGGFNPKSSRNAMIFINGSSSKNYVSNATYILKSDSVIQGYNIKAGSQLTKPVNLNGYYTGRIFGVYGFPFKKIKCNVNINGGLNYSRTPGIINNITNTSNNYASSAGIYIGSNISQNIDFSIGYNGNYTMVKNTTQKQSDNNYFTHTANFKINWVIYKGLIANTDISHTLYNGLSQSYNQNYFLWNAYVGYKFFKNKSLEFKISAFDILNQNRSIGRTITGLYTEDTYTTVLRRYLMLTATYTFKKFKSGGPPKPEEVPPGFPGGPPHPNMRPPGSGGGNN